MARRFFRGRDPATGQFKIRQSKPGHDAYSASLQNCLFDADHKPAVVLGQGQHDCLLRTKFGASPVTTFAHNCGRAPDMLVAVAVPINITNDQTTTWKYTYAGNGPVLMNDSWMDYRYCGPFWMLYGDNTGNGGIVGWQITSDATNITVVSYAQAGLVPFDQFSSTDNPNERLRVRWTALRLR